MTASPGTGRSSIGKPSTRSPTSEYWSGSAVTRGSGDSSGAAATEGESSSAAACARSTGAGTGVGSEAEQPTTAASRRARSDTPAARRGVRGRSVALRVLPAM